MKRKQLKELQRQLLAEKDQLLKLEAELEISLEESLKDSFGELSAYDNHPGDAASQLYERSKDLGLLQNTRLQMTEIEAALDSMARGSYGYCRSCGQSISSERLGALPRTLLCVRCKREEEERDLSVRPAEEELLFPPFARTFADQEDSLAPPAEDAWEDVARYGTSSDGPKS